MKASALREVVSPKRIEVTLSEGKTVTIGQFRFGELPLVLQLVEKFYSTLEKIAKDKKAKDAEIFLKAANILNEDFETVAELLSKCADVEVEDLKKMEMEPVIDLGRAIFEVNKDFLLRKVREFQQARQDQEAAAQ